MDLRNIPWYKIEFQRSIFVYNYHKYKLLYHTEIHIAPYGHNRKIVKLEYRSPSIENEEKTEFNNFELKTGAGVSAIWNTLSVKKQ